MRSAPKASRVAEKLKKLSFRGTFFAEESLILLTSNHGEIPHFARNDIKTDFSAACEAALILHLLQHGLKPRPAKILTLSHWL
jgi:hypothetical protein